MALLRFGPCIVDDLPGRYECRRSAVGLRCDAAIMCGLCGGCCAPDIDWEATAERDRDEDRVNIDAESV